LAVAVRAVDEGGAVFSEAERSAAGVAPPVTRSRAGKRHSRQQGSPGAIKTGANADIIIVDGNPLEDITLLVYPDKNLKLTMKDGRVYENTLG